MPRYAVSLLLVISLGGCLDDPDLASETSELDVVWPPPDVSLCPLVGCGKNSPIIRTHRFKDLKFAPAWGDNGFKIHSFRAESGEPLTLEVVDAKLRGRREGGGYLENHALLRSKIGVITPDGELVQIRVQGVRPVTMWAKAPGAAVPGTGEMYLLQWEDASTPIPQWKKLCPNALGNGEDPMGMLAHWSVLYEQDRVHEQTLVVHQDAAYFSIACAGHAMAKLYLTGHTHSAAVHGITHTVDQRTAMLKVLTADYLDKGLTMTLPGVPLQWKDSAGTMAFPDADGVAPWDPGLGILEARWNDKGEVICLEHPRLVWWTEPTDFGNIEDYIDYAGDRPPRCSALQNNIDPSYLGGAYLVTRVPWPIPPP